MGHRDLNAMSKISTSKHWEWFYQFCYYDMLSGGPDAHLTLAGHLSKDLPIIDRLWHAGVYVGVYNVPTAEVIWSAFPYERIMKISVEDLTQWITENWKGIATRRERKCVRIPFNMATYFKQYANWITGLQDSKFYDTNYGTKESRYEEMWLYSQKSVKFLGRYSGFKLLEYLEKWCDMPITLPDIRPVGGWSPRSMLSVLYPDYAEVLLGDDKPENLETINAIAEAGLETLRSWGLKISMFQYEVFLCDYKQCYFTQRQYPGRSQDSEIEYHTKISPYWDFQFQMFKGREEIFPSWALGEKQGWDHVRKELGPVLYNYGYMWSDSLYDFKNTLDLSVPTLKVCPF